MGQQSPQVGILLGSDSDWEMMRSAVETLEEFGVSWEVRVCSAHRTPKDAEEYARTAEGRGLKVLIAGAGGAAHLPGILAAWTVLPVIGVPIGTRPLGGVDALYSMVQMPSGVPVATVGIDAARNAALLAVQILAVSDPALREALHAFKATQAQGVRERNQRLQKEIRTVFGRSQP